MEFKSYEGMEGIELNANGEIRLVNPQSSYRLYIGKNYKYLHVSLAYYPLGKTLIKKTVSAPKAFATLFVPNPNNYKFVKPLDGNVLNLKANNLVWVPGSTSDVKKYVP